MHDKFWILPVFGLIALFLANVSRPSREASSGPILTSSRPMVVPDTIIAASVNILHGYPDFTNIHERLAAIGREIRKTKADVVLIQEDFWNRKVGRAAEVLSRHSELPYFVYARANGNRRLIRFETGQAILSRYPLHKAGVLQLPQGRNPFEHRIVLYAALRCAQGDLGLFCVHLTNGDPKNNEDQMDALIRLTDSLGYMAALIGGDFNAEPGSKTMRKVHTTWTDLLAHSQKAEPTCCVPTLDSAEKSPWSHRIDYLFIRQATPRLIPLDCGRFLDKPMQCGSTYQYASDHAGLWIKLKLE